MTKKQALEIAIRALERRRQALAVDAHLCEQYGMDTPHGLRTLREYKECQEALKLLGTMKHDSTFY